MIGCNQQKQQTDEPVPAKDLYTSPYFSCKHRYAEAVSNPGEDAPDRTTGWTILSAEYAIRWPHIKIEPYDTTIEDWLLDPTPDVDRPENVDGQSQWDDWLWVYLSKLSQHTVLPVCLADSRYGRWNIS